MFTGLIETMGKVETLQESHTGKTLSISCCIGAEELPSLGASVCISGCCLTVVEAKFASDRTILRFDVIQETLRCTTLGRLEKGQTVNIEQSLRPDSRLSGHFVQGHVDGVEKITNLSSREKGEVRLQVSMESIDCDTVVPKGSIAIDGVSLTIANVSEDNFEVALIPTTLRETTLGTLQVHDRVNIETDILARTVVESIRRTQLR